MYRLITVSTALCCAALAVGCSGTTNGKPAVPTPTRSLVARPLVERELSGLLLKADQLNATMGTRNLAITDSRTAMADNSAYMSPANCLAIDGAAEAVVYADSGFRAERDESFNDGDAMEHYLKQAVVLFADADQAKVFFAASEQQWPDCHAYTHTQSNSSWVVGTITNKNDTLSVTTTQQNARAPGWACGRALARRNNIIIDVNTCAADPGDSAQKIADQIGANVNAQW